MVWAFIFKSAKANQDSVCKMEYGDNVIYTCGVNTITEGAALAKKLHDEVGCELVELCGGFGVDGARAVAEMTGGLVRIGYVTKLNVKEE